MKRLLAFILIAACAFVGGASIPSFAAEESRAAAEISAMLGEGMVKTAETATHELYVRTEGDYRGEFLVRDKRSGALFASNPVDKEKDETARGSARFEMFSQILVYGVEAESGGERTVAGFTGAGRGEGVTISSVPGGAKITYRFENEGLTIPLYLKLTDRGLEVSCPADEIREEGDFRILRLAPAPYFGCGDIDDEGYLVLPDGSGTLIDFNNGKVRAERFAAPVYGEDLSLAKETVRSEARNLSLPVFGIRKNRDGFLAVIEKGAASARIVAQVSGQRNIQNTAYADFVLRASDTVVIGESGLSQTKQVVRHDLNRKAFETASVRYCFLERDKSGYAEMALRYREILRQKGVGADFAKDRVPFAAEFHGAVRRTEMILGLPFRKTVTLTSAEDVTEIAKELQEAGVSNPWVLLRRWNVSELAGKATNAVQPVSAFAGRRAFADLLTGDVPVYPGYSAFRITRRGNGFSKFFDAAKRLSKEPAVRHVYGRNTLYKNLNKPSGYLPGLPYLRVSLQRFARSAEKIGLRRIYAEDLGNILYSDFDDRRFSSREDMAEALAGLLADLKAEIVMKNPAAYALPYADALVGIPADDSGYDLADRSIPFYQLVVSGLLPYTGEAVNFLSNPQKAVARALETGSGLYFVWIAAETSLLKQTDADELYAASYRLWRDFAAEAYRELADAYRQLGSVRLAGHEYLRDGVTLSRYESGKAVVVNHGDEDVRTPYGLVKAGSYRLVTD